MHSDECNGKGDEDGERSCEGIYHDDGDEGEDDGEDNGEDNGEDDGGDDGVVVVVDDDDDDCSDN